MQNTTDYTVNRSGTSLREIWYTYQSEVWFGIVLAAVVAASTWLSQFIPEHVFDNILTPALNICTATAGLFGAWVIFRHSEGMRVRRLWGYALLAWCLGDTFYLTCYIVAPLQVMNMGAAHLTTFELLFGNLLGWVMVLYPTETLRPGWLRWNVVLWQLLPLLVLVALDYILPLSLWPVVALYPYALLILVLSHIRAYRIWCEENFSTMDNIDVQWIIRYCIMLFIIGANYVYICSTHGHTRGFTQQWFVVLMLVYSTEQILFRKNPWENIVAESGQSDDHILSPVAEGDAGSGLSAGDEQPDEGVLSDHIRLLEQWMETEKPYLNPDFKLMDLRAVLPTNRTYLSQLLNTTYGCSFYQFVNRYRIEEAKRLMRDCPDMKIADVSAHAGFSSSSVFSSVFSRETGLSPRAWNKANSRAEASAATPSATSAML